MPTRARWFAEIDRYIALMDHPALYIRTSDHAVAYLLGNAAADLPVLTTRKTDPQSKQLSLFDANS
jgi:hypothetical protein